MLPKPVIPGPGQESVWDYPRPPRIEKSCRHIQVYFNGILVADTRRAWRVLETSHPPVYYITREDIRMQYLHPGTGESHCEWKGKALYFTIRIEELSANNAAWYYPQPTHAYEVIKNFVAFYPGRMDACLVDGEKVTPQPGLFYGGWITSDIVGPFKGEPGTWSW